MLCPVCAVRLPDKDADCAFCDCRVSAYTAQRRQQNAFGVALAVLQRCLAMLAVVLAVFTLGQLAWLLKPVPLAVPPPPKQRVTSINEMLRRGQYLRARTALEAKVALHPDDPEWRFLVSSVLLLKDLAPGPQGSGVMVQGEEFEAYRQRLVNDYPDDPRTTMLQNLCDQIKMGPKVSWRRPARSIQQGPFVRWCFDEVSRGRPLHRYNEPAGNFEYDRFKNVLPRLPEDLTRP